MRKLALLPLLTVGLGCGGDETPTGGPQTPNLGNFPLGVYTKTLTESDVPPEHRETVGTSRLTFASDATWDLILNGERVVFGTFSVSGNQISITDGGGPYSCALVGPAYRTGTYTWSLNGSALSFTVVSDNCIGRAVGFSTKSYTKEQ